MRNEELLIRLTQTQGIAGYEKKVRELIEQEVRPYADELIVDPLGSLIAVKKRQRWTTLQENHVCRSHG